MQGGGLTQIQTFWGTFQLEFGIFLERGGGDQIPNILRNFFSIGLDVFHEKWGRITKIQTFWGTLVRLKYGFKKSSSKDSKNTGGGVKAIWTFSKQKEIFLRDGFP